MIDAAAGAEHFEQLWLPLWPYASDDFVQGIYRMARGDALKRRYIQANPDVLHNLLVVDVDHGDGLLRALSGPIRPTAVVSNRRTGRCHVVKAIAEPVTKTEYGSRKAIAAAAAVVEGFRRSLDGDQGYSGLMTKNPVHDHWDTEWVSEDLASLRELELAVADFMPRPGWRKNRGYSPAGLGRNCSIFETARTWAYREVRRHFGDSPALEAAIHARVHELNAAFADPLPNNEARGIARSIHTWIITKSRMWTDGPIAYEKKLREIQAFRGLKSGTARGGSAAVLQADIVKGVI